MECYVAAMVHYIEYGFKVVILIKQHTSKWIIQGSYKQKEFLNLMIMKKIFEKEKKDASLLINSI